MPSVPSGSAAVLTPAAGPFGTHGASLPLVRTTAAGFQVLLIVALALPAAAIEDRASESHLPVLQLDTALAHDDTCLPGLNTCSWHALQSHGRRKVAVTTEKDIAAKPCVEETTDAPDLGSRQVLDPQQHDTELAQRREASPAEVITEVSGRPFRAAHFASVLGGAMRHVGPQLPASLLNLHSLYRPSDGHHAVLLLVAIALVGIFVLLGICVVIVATRARVERRREKERRPDDPPRSWQQRSSPLRSHADPLDHHPWHSEEAVESLPPDLVSQLSPDLAAFVQEQAEESRTRRQRHENDCC